MVFMLIILEDYGQRLRRIMAFIGVGRGVSNFHLFKIQAFPFPFSCQLSECIYLLVIISPISIFTIHNHQIDQFNVIIVVLKINIDVIIDH